jgi:hypothetical protein
MKTVRIQERTCTRDNRNIYGQLYLPAEEQEKYPLVIISHGYGSNCREMAGYAAGLAEAGVACYAFDFCGGSPCSNSDGSTMEMSIITEKKDLNAVLDMALTLECVDRGHVFLMGESQGGLVAAMTAAGRADKAAGLILLYPAFCIPDDARNRFHDLDNVPEVVTVFGMNIGRSYYREALKLDQWEEIKGFEKDVLIVHGTEDEIVPVSYARKAAGIYASARLVEIRGAGHGFGGEYSRMALNEAILFVKEHVER